MLRTIFGALRFILIASGLALIAVGLGGGFCLVQGGKFAEPVERVLQESLFSLEKGGDAASKEWLAKLYKLRIWRRPETEAPGVEPGEIKVYFAPCHPLNPAGIDDHFISLLKGAKRSIYCAFYEFNLQPAADALIAKHQAGVDVAIVSDADYQDRAPIRQCIAAGIPVVFDEREALMRNKFCVVDGRRVWTGSTNITENGMYRNNNNSLLIDSGKAAQDFTAEFFEMFRDKQFGRRSPANTPFPRLSLPGAEVEVYFAPEDEVQRELIAEINAAAKTIDFLAFSFTSPEIADALIEAMKRGVKVRAMFETRGAGSQYSQDEFLAQRGASVHMDKNAYAMHNKVMVLDGETVITGSYNFSKSAEENNDENAVFLHSADLAAAYAREFERLLN